MGITESLLGRKNVDGNPHIDAIDPPASLPGGEVRIIGRALKPPQLTRPEVSFSGVHGSIVVSSESFVIARVPYGADSGQVMVKSNGHVSNGRELKIAQPIAESLHPVANPFKIDTNYNVKPFLPDLMNATGMAFDADGYLYVSSRYDGTVYRVAPNGTMSTYAEGLGIATGIAFDRDKNLYVGDRSGTIWRIAPDRQIFVFATLEPSVAAYHLAFAPDRTLYICGPTTSSFDAVYSVDPQGSVAVFYRGLGRPQGLAFDAQGNLYVAASIAGKRGIVRITRDRQASLVIAGQNLVGPAFTRTGGAVLATTTSVFHLTWDVQGLPLI